MLVERNTISDGLAVPQCWKRSLENVLEPQAPLDEGPSTQVSPTNLQKIERLYVPQKTKNTEMLEGPPAEVAKKLVEKLRNEARVI